MAKRTYKLQEFIAHTADVKCLSIGKKSCRVFVTGGDDRKLNLWEVGRSTSLLSLSGHTSTIESVTFDSAETLILAGASSGTIKLWDLEEAKIVRTLTGHRSKCFSLEFHPFGEFFASGSLDTELKIWDIRKKGCIHTYNGHTRGIKTIRFTPDGRWVVSGGEDNVVKVWDLTAGKLLHDFKFHCGAISSIDFHPHEFLLATGSTDQTVKFWDLETFELIGSAAPQLNILSLNCEILPTRSLVSTRVLSNRNDGHAIRVGIGNSTRGGDRNVKHLLNNQGNGVRSMIFHPDGKTLFCGSDETLKVFSWEPVRCHDDVEVGWSVLSDLSIYEGKLLGCSYHQSSVGVWVADISLIGPYATDAISASSDSVGPVSIDIHNHTFKRRKNSFKSSGTSLKESDQTSDVKEIIHTEPTIANDVNQKSSGKVDFFYVPKATSSFPTVLRRNIGKLSWDEEKPSSKSSTSTMTLSQESPATENHPHSPATENHPHSPARKDSDSLTRVKLSKSSRFSGTTLLNLRKTSSKKMITGRDAEIAHGNACVPLVIPRDDNKLQEATNCRKDNCRNDNYVSCHMPQKSIHVQVPLYGGGDHIKSVSDVTKPITIADEFVGSNSLQELAAHSLIEDTELRDQRITQSVSQKFERVMLLDRTFGSFKEKGLETKSSGSEMNPVKYVKGVAIQHGRTKSLVESWERRDIYNNNCARESSLSSYATKIKVMEQEEQNTDFGSEDYDDLPVSLLQNRDLFINMLKSRLTKLQMVRHCWERNGLKDTVGAIVKLPDHSVQADVICVLVEKFELFNLEVFSCCLPLLVGLLGSTTERHIDISMEMLVKLARVFGPLILSTLATFSPIGIDIEAEKRRNLCSQCFVLLEKLKKMLPLLTRKGGSIGRRAMELNLALQQL